MDHLSDVRIEGESFEDYKNRQRALKYTTKVYKRGFAVSFQEHLYYQAMLKQIKITKDAEAKQKRVAKP